MMKHLTFTGTKLNMIPYWILLPVVVFLLLCCLPEKWWSDRLLLIFGLSCVTQIAVFVLLYFGSVLYPNYESVKVLLFVKDGEYKAVYDDCVHDIEFTQLSKEADAKIKSYFKFVDAIYLDVEVSKSSFGIFSIPPRFSGKITPPPSTDDENIL